MRKAFFGAVTAALFVWSAPARAAEGCMVPSEFKTLWPPPGDVVFQPTSLDERAVFRMIVPPLVQAAKGGGELPVHLKVLAARVGFAIEEWSHEGERFWALVEKDDARRGAGAYVLRVGEARDVAVQSPHAYFDLGTGSLGAALFVCAPEGMRPRAFLTNTSHRFRGRPGERREDPDHPADVAHNPDHLFQTVTDLLAGTLPELRVVQLHGFGTRSSERGRISAVVSGGTRAPPRWTRNVAVRLEQLLGDGVRLYPDQTELLGATRNAQGRLLQAHPRTHFVHIELSPQVRRAMSSKDKVRALAKALFDPEEGS